MKVCERSRNLAALVLLFSLTGCASVHHGKYAKAVDLKGKYIESQTGLVISGKEIRPLSSEYFGVISFNIENKSEKWVRIKKVSVDFIGSKTSDNVRIVQGRDFEVWNKAQLKKISMSEHNSALFRSALTSLGIAVALSDSNETVKKAGAAAALASESYAVASKVVGSANALNQSDILPESHLLSGEIYVAPGLFERRWILLNSTNHDKIHYIRHIYLEYETEDGLTERLVLKFRGFSSTSLWQKKIKNRTLKRLKKEAKRKK